MLLLLLLLRGCVLVLVLVLVLQGRQQVVLGSVRCSRLARRSVLVLLAWPPCRGQLCTHPVLLQVALDVEDGEACREGAGQGLTRGLV